MAGGDERTGLDKDSTRTVRGSAANYLAALFQIALFAFHVLAARLFGRVAYGAYLFAWSLVEMACKIGIVGMDKGILRAVAVARTLGDLEGQERAASTALRTAMLSSAFVILVLWGIAAFQQSSEYRLAIFFLSPVVMTWSLTLVLVGATMATGTMRYNLLVRGIWEPTAMVFSALFFGLFLGRLQEVGVSLAHLTASATTVFLAALAFRNRLGIRFLAKKFLLARTDWSLVKFAIPIMPAELFNQAIYRLDIVLLGLYTPGGSAIVASYGASVLLASVISSVRYAFDPILSPIVAECTAKGDIERLKTNSSRMTRWVLGLSMPLAIPVAVFGDVLLGLWGQGYGEAHSALAILCVAHLVNSALGLHQWLVVMSGRSRLDLVNNFAAFLVIVTLNLLLIPVLGLKGAAIATLAGNVVLRGLQVAQVRRLLKVNPFDTHFFRLLGAGFVGLGFESFVKWLYPGPGWMALVIGGLGGAILTWALYFIAPATEDQTILLKVRRHLGLVRRR